MDSDEFVAFLRKEIVDIRAHWQRVRENPAGHNLSLVVRQSRALIEELEKIIQESETPSA